MTVLALELLATMRNQVGYDYTLICGIIGAETAFEQDVLGGFQRAAGIPHKCGSITFTKQRDCKLLCPSNFISKVLFATPLCSTGSTFTAHHTAFIRLHSGCSGLARTAGVVELGLNTVGT